MRLDALPRHRPPTARPTPRPDPDRPTSLAECRQLGHATIRLLNDHLPLPRPDLALYSSEACLAVPLLSDLLRTSPEQAARHAHLVRQLLPRPSASTRLPSADTALLALHQLPVGQLADRLQALLTTQVVVALRQGAIPSDQPLILAADCHEIPTYHKKRPATVRHPRTSEALLLAVSTKPDVGTNLAFRFLTFHTTRGAPLTVLAEPVFPLDSLTRGLLEGLDTVERRLGRSVDLFLHDAAAYGSETLAALQRRKTPFIVRAPQNARVARELRQHQGLRAFALTDFPVRLRRDRVEDERVAVTLIAVSRELLEGRGVDLSHTERRIRWFTYATNVRPHPGESETDFALRIALLYSERWDVETSYRQIEEFRGFTHALRYDLRLLQFGLAVILANLWALQRHGSRAAWTEGEVALFLTFGVLFLDVLGQRGVARQELEIPSGPVHPSVPLR